MAKETLPITPSVVRWARERAGFTLEELAKDFKKIADWEAGKEGPTYPQLEGLADKLKVPVAVFFFPEAPRTPPIEETFRTLPEASLNSLPSRMKLLLRKAKALQLNLAELHAGQRPSERSIIRDLPFGPVALSGNVKVLAKRVREYLAIDLQTQKSWANEDIALKNWRSSFQSVGIYVFKDAFKAPEFSGFCLTDDLFPIIYVNNSCSKTRQIFTLFHELAHLLFQTSGIDALREIKARAGAAERIEVICNQFAAEFLLPETEFQRAREGLGASEGTAEQLAARYKVSREMIFRRFLDLGEISAGEYESAARKWTAQRQPGSGGDPHRTKLAYLGREYVSLALGAFYKNRIDERQLSEYLDTKPRYLGDLESRFAKGAAA